MSEPAGQPSVPPRKGFRWGLYLPYVVLLLLAAGISAFWFIARDRVEAAVDDWMAREASLGRAWTCPDRALSGFPMRFEISCNRPTFAGESGGRQIQGEMAGFKAVAQIYDPNLVVLDFTGPAIVREVGAGEALRLAWQGFSLSVRRTADSFSRMSVYMKKPVLAALGGQGSETVLGSAEAWDAHVRPDPAAGASEDMWDVVSQIVKANVPASDMLFGDPGTLNIELQAALNNGQMLARGASPTQIDQWRDAGGRLKIVLLKLSRGDRIIEARGSLGVDNLRRPVGQLEVRAAGVSDLLARLTGRRGGVGGLLAGGLAMLGGSQGERQARAAPGGDQLAAPALTSLPPLVFANGQLMIGPFPVMRLPSLY